MGERFERLGIPLYIYSGVPITDPRIRDYDIPESDKRLWSVTYGHLDMIQQFYNTDKKYGFFCEDDVMIHRDLPTLLPSVMAEFDAMNLDILLLGHMTTYKIERWMQDYSVKHHFEDRPYSYHNYPSQHWGAHLYMISRNYAKWLLEKYESGYAYQSYVDKSLPAFSPDWTITKNCNRALMYPMLAVEDGNGEYPPGGQRNFHMDSHRINCIPGIFI
jgi:hypothetical protein